MINKGKVNKQKIVLVILGIMLLIQTIFFKTIFESPNIIRQSVSELYKNNVSFSENFIENTIRTEQRRVLLTIRQGWIRYSTLFPEKFFVKDGDWVSVSIKEISDIIISPVRIFGTHSRAIIYDIQTGDIIYAPHLKTMELEKLIDPDTNKPNIKNFYKLSVNKGNEEQVKNVYTELLGKVDTDSNSKITSLVFETNQMDSNDVNDFSKYPLGEHNRVFIEKIILPHESIEIGEDKQLGLIIEINEQEIMSPYKNAIKQNDNLLHTIEQENNSLERTAKSIIVISLICIIASVAYARIVENEFYKD